jgi:hypothetical protein
MCGDRGILQRLTSLRNASDVCAGEHGGDRVSLDGSRKIVAHLLCNDLLHDRMQPSGVEL